MGDYKKIKKKNIRQHYFLEKELRSKAALFTLFVLFGGLALQFITKKLNTVIASPAIIPLVFAGYILIIVFCAVYFTQRFMGPFPRLARELRKVVETREYNHVLHIRGKDDQYIQHFIDAVNLIIEHVRQETHNMERITRKISEDLDLLIRDIERGGRNTEMIKGKLEELHKYVAENRPQPPLQHP